MSPDETAFVHRRSLFSCQFLAYWREGADVATTTRCESWIREFHRDMLHDSTGGAYINYADPELRDWHRAYYGSNYDRLVRVKSAYDPDGLFKMPRTGGSRGQWAVPCAVRPKRASAAPMR